MKYFIFFFSLLIISVFGNSQSNYSFGKWDTTLTSMPSARSSFSALTYHDSIYILGGFRKLGAPENVSSVDVYVPETDTWITGITEFPFPRGCPNACLIGDKIYAFGGSHVDGENVIMFDSLHIYDIKSNSWERGQCLPTDISYFGADTIGGKIYVVGGGGTGYSIYNTLYVYDPELDEWIEKASMNNSRWGTCARSWNGKLYVFGGYSGSNWTISKTIEVYDPETDEWTNLTSAKTPRTSMTMFFLDGQFYIIGGYNNPSSTSYNHTKIISTYDIATDTWFDFFHQGDNIPDGRRLSAYTMFDDKFYLLGGGGDEDIMNNIWSYSLKTIYQKKVLKDTLLSLESIEFDLDDYFLSTTDDALNYSVCEGYNNEMINVSLNNSALTIDKLIAESGSTEVAVNVFNTEDTISSNSFVIDIPTGINIIGESKLSVFPNPASNQLNINVGLNIEDKIDVYLTEVVGRKIYIGNFVMYPDNNVINIKLDIYNLNQGMYILELQGEILKYPLVKLLISN